MSDDQFEVRVSEFRPRLHRYCARMIGSAVDGEDVVQDTLVKALRARDEGKAVSDVEAWLLRIAHNTCLDFLRHRSRHKVVPIMEVLEDASTPDPHIVDVSFHVFMRLPELQRCAVIFKGVLGHSIDEVASIADCTPAAAKSALQRGRAALRHWAQRPDETRVPLMSDADRKRVSAYVRLFQQGDFDAIRAMLAEDVKLDLVNRLKLEGREKVDRYFTRYAEVSTWRYAFGAIEGRPAMLVFDHGSTAQKPAHFVLIDWQGDRIAGIRDFLFTSYAIKAADWVLLS